MINYLKCYYKEDKLLLILLFISISISYAVYLIPNKELIGYLGKEDCLFENLTAIFFLVASGICLRNYIDNFNIFFLLLAILFFVGFGEEISWGQRLFDFATPESLRKINVQKEFTIHNIVYLNSVDLNQQTKTGMSRFLSVNFLFKVFWFIYGILIPLAFLLNKSFAKIANKLRFPVPKISIGIFFLFNYIIMKTLEFYLTPFSQLLDYCRTNGEIYECGAALVFMILSYDFYKRRNSMFLKQTA